MKRVVPRPGLVIREDTRFEPGIHRFDTDEGITVAADGVRVDGRGAVLERAAPPPALPPGDWLYSPGDMGLSREEHVLALRGITPDARSNLALVYRYWGSLPDQARAAVSADRRAWRELEARPTMVEDEGWVLRRFALGEWPASPLHLRLTVPPAAVRPDAPCFYDQIRIVSNDHVVFRGDAREGWIHWYNTGFSLLKRAEKRWYSGVAIHAEGQKDVRLANVSARGFLTGLSLRGCAGWVIEGNDFSGNYDDPDYGWGDGTERYGAIYLEDVHDSVLRRNRGCRVWNGIALRRSSGNRIERNTFSHCSNTCLKLAQSRDNTIADNDFSWGIRIYPEEVHARDSVSLLVESGSDGNRFLRNDFRHGGDGVFIRVLNGWCSTGNHFVRNDCSWANNNAIESWSPGNRYVRNRANRSSYGFWLGGSDETTLIGNEIRHNGKAFRNAPEPFGNAGLSVVHGSSTGFLVAANRIEDNSGPGISLACREDTPARNWLIAGNRIRGNRNDDRGYPGHGVFAELCRDIHVLGNDLGGNEGRAVVLGRGAIDVVVDQRRVRVIRDLAVQTGGAPRPSASVEIRLAGDLRGLETWRWDLGDGTVRTTTVPRVEHTWASPGRVRVTVSSWGRRAAGRATSLFRVLPEGRPVPGETESWTLRTTGTGSVSREGSAVEAVVRGGAVSTLTAQPAVPLDFTGAAGLSWFYRYTCELNTHTGKRNRAVGIRLSSGGDDLLEHDTRWDPGAAPSEDRYDWVYVRSPWSSFQATGKTDLSSIRRVELFFGPEEASDFLFRVDEVRAW